jgi:hypothetical protein
MLAWVGNIFQVRGPGQGGGTKGIGKCLIYSGLEFLFAFHSPLCTAFTLTGLQ